MKRAIYIILTAVLAASCVYRFEPEGIVSQKRVVIEGDILIGGITKVDVRSTSPIIYDQNFDASAPIGNAWIEDDRGHTYEDMDHMSGKSSFTFDTRRADVSCSYRLHFKDLSTGKEYVSSWQSVVAAPQVTGMSFDYDEENVNLRMDVDGKDNQFLRWDYLEEWEYHADYAPTYYFDLISGRVMSYNNGMPDYTNYWCWNKHESTEFGLASTEQMSANRLDQQIIETYERKNLRFQSYYRMDVTVRGLTKEAYDYLHNMREISDITGSLFAPSPDDMRGNIVCQQDTTEFVIGYISAVQVEKKRMYIGGRENVFFKPTPLTHLSKAETPLRELYSMGARPVVDIPDETAGTVVGWGPERCINCLFFGGSKNRPEDWPTSNGVTL